MQLLILIIIIFKQEHLLIANCFNKYWIKIPRLNNNNNQNSVNLYNNNNAKIK